MKLRHLAWGIVPLLIGAAAFEARSGKLSHQWAVWAGTEPILESPGTIDLGDCEIGKVAVARFALTNRGGGELVIDQVRTNCSCSGLEREEGGGFVRIEQLCLGPREQINLVMRVMVGGRVGNSTRNVVTFRTNDPTRPEGRIEVVVPKVTGGVTTVPASLVFDTLTAGSEARQILEVYDGAIHPRSVERVSSTNPGQVAVQLLTPEVSAPETGGQGLGVRIARIEVVLQANQPGLVRSAVEIHLAGERHPPTSVPVSGRVAAAVELQPSTLVLPRASGEGPKYFGTCLCRSREGMPLHLTVESTSAGLTVQVSPVESNPAAKLVRIEWDPGSEKEASTHGPRFVRFKARAGDLETAVQIPVLCQRGGGE